MSAYRRLLSNTFLFSVSTFGSKILTFLLTPFYTSILSDAEYGVTDLIIQTGNFLIPLASIGVVNAALRFGLDGRTDKTGVFTTGMAAVLAGEGVLVLLYPLLTSIGLMEGYTVLLLLYVLMANLHSLCGAMAQALGKIRLYAAGGILCTALVVVLNILLLAVFRMGITGYILSNIIADGVTALVLFAALRLWRYLNPQALRRSLAGSMFRYCLPLIPATVCSWVINISDRYFISYLIGSDVSGQYAVAGKVSMALLTVSGIFTDAWQLSIVSNRPREEKGQFFSNVFSVFEAGVLSAAAVLIAAAPLIIRLLAAPGYFTAWHYVPLLVLGAAVASLGSFFSSVYTSEMRTSATFMTTLLGAAVNLAGNALLIPRWGAMGAAAATLLSYLLILIFRAAHSHRLLPFRWGVWRFIAAMAVLLAECLLMEMGRFAAAAVCCAAVLLLYCRPMARGLKSGVLEVVRTKRRG